MKGFYRHLHVGSSYLWFRGAAGWNVIFSQESIRLFVFLLLRDGFHVEEMARRKSVGASDLAVQLWDHFWMDSYARIYDVIPGLTVGKDGELGVNRRSVPNGWSLHETAGGYKLSVHRWIQHVNEKFENRSSVCSTENDSCFLSYGRIDWSKGLWTCTRQRIGRRFLNSRLLTRVSGRFKHVSTVQRMNRQTRFLC